jgi:hypothetical protein
MFQAHKWFKAICMALVVLAFSSASPVLAATLTVTNLNDSGSGSLRQAIAAAAPGDTINFRVTGTITLTSGELLIQKNLTISGPGASSLAISGNSASRVFEIGSATVAISGLTIENGSAATGGGILNSGTLILTDSTVSGNFASGGGGIENYGTLTVTNSTISGNSGTLIGGSRSGGGIENFGPLTITKSTFSGNSSSYGAGINSNPPGTVALTNSTLSGNSAGYQGGGISFNAPVTLSNSTLSGNSSPQGGNLNVYGPLTVKNSILANAPSGGNCFFAFGATSQGHNLSDDLTCSSYFTQTGDLNNTPAGLDPSGLQNNGGPTKTIALLPTSPAVDAIPVSPVNYCTDTIGMPITTDQRGITRPQGPACDIGAFELVQANLEAVTATGAQFGATEGVTFTGTVATFTDPDRSSTAAEYSATIDWGDSTATTPGTISGPTGGPFTVSGSHMYVERGTYAVTVVIADIDTPSNTATAHSAAIVGDARLSSMCATPPVSTQTYTGPTAIFTDQSSTGTLSDFSATISWGDSSSSPGTITGGPGNAPYTVSGTHTYASTGTFLISTTINDVDGSTTTPACSVTVFAFATGNGAAFVIGDLEAGLGNHVTWWSSQWAKINLMSGGPPPASMKGFAGFEDNFLGLPPPNCGGSWSTDTGNSTPPPPTVPTLMGVIVSSRVTQSGSIISGDIKEVVVVRNDPGYGPSPGNPGTGTEIAIVCTVP